MNNTIYEDYKYTMQDTSSLYIGAKYTFAEMLDNDELNFKFRLVLNKYILPEADPEDSLETHLYYLDKKSFLVKIYDQLKARIKVNVIEEKKSILGSAKKEYVTKTMKINELVEMSVKEKEAKGLVIQELRVSKLALLSF